MAEDFFYRVGSSAQQQKRIEERTKLELGRRIHILEGMLDLCREELREAKGPCSSTPCILWRRHHGSCAIKAKIK